jgi:hypothetical protein
VISRIWQKKFNEFAKLVKFTQEKTFPILGVKKLQDLSGQKQCW